MTSHRKQPFRLGLFIFLLLGCLFALVGLVVLVDVPQQVADRLGPPATHLSWPERKYLAWILFLNESQLSAPSSAQGVSGLLFTVNEGESALSVIQRLEQVGIIRDAETFRTFLIYSGLDKGIQAGQYELSPTMDAIQVAYALQKGGRFEVTVTILAGWRAEEIAQVLRLSGLLDNEMEFLDMVRNPPALPVLESLEHPQMLEGFLMPGTYTFRRDAPVQQIIEQMLERFAQTLTPEIRTGFMQQGLTLYQGIILASIVEREGVVKEEYPLIASVFLNRLKAGMKLDSDPTVQYALGYDARAQTWWKNPLSADDLRADSPYNTYIYSGLPPTPICNPGLDALQSVAHPAQTPYYYFRARCDQSGRHIFAETYNEHLSNACQ
ncbi:endolytic transglycosylase MltG [uncultured Thermanaerothrix sp.]|uniref:endolytic transglycosylase MltG n=1 Tax=uncultured Thermanaerothrix sp. TaxID=1195149 RepID=UPI002639A306|nr:endolytic transglycosylase MltG [uncultured Thermanaerothrix sp.]